MAPNIHWFYLALALARTMARDGQRVAEGLPAGDEAEDKLFIYSLGLLLLKHAVPKNTKRTPATVRIDPIICIYTELLLTAALMISAVPVNMSATAGSTISPLPIRQLSHLFFCQTLEHLVVS